MVVVDQFEELFAFRRVTAIRHNVAVRDEAAGFVSLLLRTASDSDARVWVVLTMRSDFIGDCEAFLGLPEAVSRSQFLVPRLDRGQMESAIGGPAEVSEAGFRPFAFENGLVNLMINEAGDRPDQLPLLQHALMRTWKCAVLRAESNGSVVRLIHDDYSEEAGGIENALSRHADAAWNTIKDDPKKSAIARRLFLLLCDVSSDGQIIRRRPKIAEVQAVTGAFVPEIEEVVRLFQDDDRNFLLPPRGDDFSSETYLDISHEALLRQWQRFASEWLVQERSDAEELRRLAQQAFLRRQGKGGFIGRDDLDRILRWKDCVSGAWALRYVPKDAWLDVLGYTDDSVTEDKRQRNREKRWLWIVWIALGLGTIASVIFGVEANWAEQRAVAAKEAADELINFMQYDLSDILGKLGQLRMMEDINARIRLYHEEHPTEAGDAAARDAADRERSVALDQQGNILLYQGRLGEALKAYRDSLGIAEKLAKQDPGNAGWQRDLSVSYKKVGDVQRAQGDLAGALKSYSDSLGIREKLAQQDPGNAGWQRDLSVSYEKVGDVQSAQGDLAGALRATATALGSSRSWPGRTPAMRAGSATSRSATTRSATCRARRATWPARSRATGTALHR